jgi:hypothetical protein
MEKPLMLLPFVHGIDTLALSSALTFAQKVNATLLLASLIPLPQGSRKRSIRAEAIAQTYDFEEFMTYKAARAGVTIRCTQLSTQQITRSIHALAQEMACVGIMLFVRDGTGVLLETEDIKQLLEQGSQPIYLFHLTSRKDQLSHAYASLTGWLQGLMKHIFLLSPFATSISTPVLHFRSESASSFLD